MNKIKSYIENHFSCKRLVHILSVANTALFLNKLFNLNINEKNIIIAGLSHDMSKWMNIEIMKNYISEKKIILDEYEMKHPQLWHPGVSEHILKNEFMIEDREVLDAVRFHTIGYPDMDFLSKVLYCADYIEPTRKFYSHVDFNVLNNLDKLLEFVVKNKLKHIG
ncbi:bis(5'-nucleosyl)-tetraphosphatase (symmetrical) YqeK, partial [Candidatus Dependentiae bacterium]|nr:bis(5'-nucleosyl)-tetraphosphatase (symmetrical) YqeK [Candidatus Dependentiae bacterium]